MPAGVVDLAAYVPRLLLEWEAHDPSTRHRTIVGTLVFADVSGFTRLSERLARAGGKLGAEQMTDVIDHLFGQLLHVAAARGGEMLKYGGDAVLLFFTGDAHATRAVAACHEMQARLRDIGRVDSGTGPVRLRMSVGVSSGDFDFFKVGGSHQELIVAGPSTTACVAMEAAADATEVLLDPSTVALVSASCTGREKAGGRLLRRAPDAPLAEPSFAGADADPRAFISVGLRDHLASGRVESDHRLTAVGFLHVMGVDRSLRSAGPEATADHLASTLTTVQDALDEYGVTFLATDVAADGVKVLAAAGTPRAVEEPEQRLVRSIRRVLTSGLPLDVRAGVQRGHVFAGEVGPPFRKTYTTIGDVINTAARVMGRAAPGELLALRDVTDHLGHGFELEELEAFVAKGKAEPLVPVRVGDERERLDNNGLDARLPLVGRTRDFDRVHKAAAALAAGGGGFVEISGAAGMGKSRLVEELLGAHAEVRRFVLRCEPYEKSTPFFPFRHLLSAVLGVRARDAAAVAQLEEAVAAISIELLPWVPLLGDVLDLDIADTDQTRPLEAKYRRQRTNLVVAELLSRSLHEPAIIVVEDAHWADDASTALLQHVASHASRRRWLLIATTREPAAWAWRAGVAVPLEPLDDRDGAALVRAAAGRPLHPDRIAEMVARAAGNPLFLLELERHAAASGALPDTLEAVVASQIDALPSDARALIRHAAVLGSAFEPALLRAVSDRTVPLRPEALARKLGGLVVVEDGVRLRFRHQVLRDVAYAALPYRLRRTLHERAGAAIERDAGTDPGEKAGILALHFAEAQDHARVWQYARDAAERAAAKFANVEAVAFLDRAIAAARHLRDVAVDDLLSVTELQGDVHGLAGASGAAKDAYQRARRHAGGQPAALARLCRKQARLIEQEGRPTAALRWLQRGVHAIADDDGDAAAVERAALLAAVAWTKQAAGRPRAALRWARLAIGEGERSSNIVAVALAHSVIDGAAIALGEPRDPANAARAIALLEEAEAHKHLAVLLNNLGAHAYHQGRWDEALDLYERGRERNTLVGDLVEAGYQTYNVAEILCDQGHVDDASKLLDDAEATWGVLGFTAGMTFVEAQRGRVALRRGDFEGARALLDSACTTLHVAGLHAHAVPFRLALAEAMVRNGDTASARAVVDATLADPLATRLPGALAAAHRLAAYLALADVDLDRAWQAANDSLATARAHGSPHDVALALEAMSMITETSGDRLDDALARERDGVLGELGIVLSRC